jgi:hypothetical protein
MERLMLGSKAIMLWCETEKGTRNASKLLPILAGKPELLEAISVVPFLFWVRLKQVAVETGRLI